MEKFKIGDVIKYMNVSIFSYEANEIGEIEFDKEYIITEMDEDTILISDGILEFMLDEMSLLFATHIRRMRFKIGEKLRITDLSKFKFTEEIALKENMTYEVIDVTIREGSPVIFDGINEVALFVEEMLFVEKVQDRTKRSKKGPKKNDTYTYFAPNKEIADLQEHLVMFNIESAIDKLLDEKNYDALERVVNDFFNKLNNQNHKGEQEGGR